MTFFAYHGALAAERELGQRFVVDVEMALDLRPAGESDELAHTVNYGAVYDTVRTIVEGPPCNLIETVGERIAARILEGYEAVEEVRVCVRKPEVAIKGVLAAAEVEIVRER